MEKNTSDNAKEWTEISLNEMWVEPEDHVAYRNRDSRVVTYD